MRKKLFVALSTILVCMLSLFAASSCSDDDDTVDMSQLSGSWERTYPKDVVAEGFVVYTFKPSTATCEIFVYDALAAKDTTQVKSYYVSDDNHEITIFDNICDDQPHITDQWQILKLTHNKMVWYSKEADETRTFRRTSDR